MEYQNCTENVMGLESQLNTPFAHCLVNPLDGEGLACESRHVVWTRIRQRVVYATTNVTATCGLT